MTRKYNSHERDERIYSFAYTYLYVLNYVATTFQTTEASMGRYIS